MDNLYRCRKDGHVCGRVICPHNVSSKFLVQGCAYMDWFPQSVTIQKGSIFALHFPGQIYGHWLWEPSWMSNSTGNCSSALIPVGCSSFFLGHLYGRVFTVYFYARYIETVVLRTSIVFFPGAPSQPDAQRHLTINITDEMQFNCPDGFPHALYYGYL